MKDKISIANGFFAPMLLIINILVYIYFELTILVISLISLIAAPIMIMDCIYGSKDVKRGKSE